MSPSEVLTPFQSEVLNAFFAMEVGRDFFFTGGTALAGFYFQHRLSDDLDFFTVSDAALPRAREEMEVLASALSLTLESRASAPHFQRFRLTRPGLAPLQLDLVRDIDVQIGQHRWFDAIIVDALENIGANKVGAIFGRTEAKDFVDLYFLLEAGLNLRELIAHAKQKDGGVTEFWLAEMMRQVEWLKHLPVMLKPVSLDSLKAYFLQLADELLLDIEPPR